MMFRQPTRQLHRIVLLVVLLGVIALPAAAAGNSEEILVSDFFFDTFIVDALNDIALQTGIPIIVDSTVSGFITMELLDIPLEDALRRICIPGGFTFRLMEEGYYLVGAADPANPTFSLLSELEIVKARYLQAATLQSMLSGHYANFIKIDPVTNTLAITASPEMIRRIKADIAQIDVPVRQVMLEVLVTELSRTASAELGTDWQWNMEERPTSSSGILSFTARTLTSTLGFRYPDGVAHFFLSLKALAEDGEAKIHANPRLVAMDGHKAEIFLGEEQSYIVVSQTEAGAVTRQRLVLQTGVSLAFLPQISAEGEITLMIEPEVSSIIGYNQEGYPIVSARRASTTLRVRDGETFVLGGLLHDYETQSTKKLPILGDIPLLGKLFRSERTEQIETEVVILVTPVLVDEGSDRP